MDHVEKYGGSAYDAMVNGKLTFLIERYIVRVVFIARVGKFPKRTPLSLTIRTYLANGIIRKMEVLSRRTYLTAQPKR